MEVRMQLDSLRFIVGHVGVTALFTSGGAEELTMKGTGCANATVYSSLPLRQKLYQQELQRADSVVKWNSF